MSSRWVGAAPISISILFAFVLGAVVYSERNQQRAQLGKRAPDFTLEDLQGNPVSLSDFKGRVVFINFWTTWCDACREETPALQAFHERYGDKVVQLGINLREPVDKIQAFMDELGATYRVLRDKDARVSALYRLKAVPESWFIDPDGVARVYRIGALTFEEMQEAYRATVGRPIDGARVPGPTGSPYTLAVDPVRSGRLSLGSHDLLLISDDEARSWTAASPPGYADRTTHFVSAGGRKVLDAFGHGAGVAASWDGGQTWREVGKGLLQKDVHSLAAGPEGRALYAWIPTAGLYAIGDGGRAWRAPAKSTDPTLEHLPMAVDPQDSSHLWAGTPEGLLTSWDAGQTWQLASVERGVFGISVSPTYPDRLCLGTDRGVWLIEVRGTSARWLAGSPARRFDDVIALPGRAEDVLIAVAANGDVYRSFDGGLPWRLLNGADGHGK